MKTDDVIMSIWIVVFIIGFVIIKSYVGLISLIGTNMLMILIIKLHKKQDMYEN